MNSFSWTKWNVKCKLMNLVSSNSFEPALSNRNYTFVSNDFVCLYIFIFIVCFHRPFSMSFTYFHFNCWLQRFMMNDDCMDGLQLFQLKWNRIQFGLISWKNMFFAKNKKWSNDSGIEIPCSKILISFEWMNWTLQKYF